MSSPGFSVLFWPLKVVNFVSDHFNNNFLGYLNKIYFSYLLKTINNFLMKYLIDDSLNTPVV